MSKVEDLHKKWLQDAKYRKAHQELTSEFELARAVIAARATAGLTQEQLAQKIPKFRRPENINIIVAGGDAGKFSAVFAGWVSGPMGSSSVSRRIEEVI